MDAPPADATLRTIVCPVCLHVGARRPGPGGRPAASCARCGSLERHRALAGILSGVAGVVERGCIADIAPSPLIAARLGELAAAAGVPYVGVDFDPAADSRVVNVQASLTGLPLPAASVGLMICFHVLEHIPDDAAAMREMARVLAPGGVALVQVPWRQGVPTDEDPGATVEERITRFGQADHVRYYGDDLEDRLGAAGLKVERIVMGDLYDGWLADLLGILHDEPMWICSVGGAIGAAELAEPCGRAGRDTVAAGLARAAAERDEAQAATGALRERIAKVRRGRQRARDRVAALEGRLDVRASSALRRGLRRGVRVVRRRDR